MSQFKIYRPTYENLLKFLNGKNQKIIGNNTIAIKSDDCINIQYHDSVIATIGKDAIYINPCGWFTSTTKERLNWVLGKYPYTISQTDFTWFICNCDNNWQQIGKLTDSGLYNIKDDTWNGLQSLEDNTRKDKIKAIKKYAKEYIDLLCQGKLGSPSHGDCLYCQLNFSDSWDHIESHIEESYFVPSLIFHAIEFKDVSHVAKWVIQDSFDGFKEKLNTDSFLSVARQQVYASLWKYCLHCYDIDNK